MAKRLFIISGITDKESEDIITLLNDNYINFYITQRGGWMQSLETIWVKDHSQLEHAQNILHSYFHEEYVDVEKNDELLKYANKSMFQKIFSNPTVYALYIPTLIIITLMVFLLA